MTIDLLKTSELEKFSKFAIETISQAHHYSLHAREEEIKKFSKKSILHDIRHKDHIYIIAKRKNDIVGFACGYFDAETFWMDWICVEKDTRRKGVAKEIINFLIKTTKKNKAYKIWCDTRTTNKHAINLMKKMKFKKTGLFKKHWYGQDFYFWERILR
jgi:ribosomal protein S18 acetylase RimI-like enzyme